MHNQVLSVSQVVALPAGSKDNPSWVNGGFTGICRSVEKKKDNMWVARFSDDGGGDVVEVAVFSPPRFQQGDEVTFSGKGMRREQYKETAQVKIGKDTKIESRPGKEAMSSSMRGDKAQQASSALIPGAQVGGAVKAVYESLTRHMDVNTLATELAKPSFWGHLHAAASDFIRVSQMLERGALADPVKVRAPAPAHAAGNGRPSHDPERELSEDVPF